MNGSIEEMTPDTILSGDGTVIQHGPVNDRVYLMKMDRGAALESLEKVEWLAATRRYSKIFVKVPASAVEIFAERGYMVEAVVPGLFRGRDDGYFLARYPAPERMEVIDAGVIRDVLGTALSRAAEDRACAPPPGFTIRPVAEEDTRALAQLYGAVFETYPFPIHDPGYLRQTMQTHIRYYIALREGRLVAASSAEMDPDTQSVEMTDFATYPSYQGMGLCSALLKRMEGDMRDEGLRTAFTIARAALYPINITFARAGYRYGGTLVNNTQICGSFESMNVWYKRLA
jgi:putative beta-lysine N-acetyltransferase